MFTSSGGVFAENNGGSVNEKSEVTTTERSKNMLAAEAEALSLDGGIVLRFGGLYTL